MQITQSRMVGTQGLSLAYRIRMGYATYAYLKKIMFVNFLESGEEAGLFNRNPWKTLNWFIEILSL